MFSEAMIYESSSINLMTVSEILMTPEPCTSGSLMLLMTSGTSSSEQAVSILPSMISSFFIMPSSDILSDRSSRASAADEAVFLIVAAMPLNTVSSRAAGVMFTRDMLSETGAMLSINVLLPHEAYISQETPVLTQAKSISGQRLSQAGLR